MFRHTLTRVAGPITHTPTAKRVFGNSLDSQDARSAQIGTAPFHPPLFPTGASGARGEMNSFTTHRRTIAGLTQGAPLGTFPAPARGVTALYVEDDTVEPGLLHLIPGGMYMSIPAKPGQHPDL